MPLTSQISERKSAVVANDHAVRCAVELDDVQRPASGDTQTFALAQRVVVDTAMASNHFSGRRDQIALFFGHRFAPLT